MINMALEGGQLDVEDMVGQFESCALAYRLQFIIKIYFNHFGDHFAFSYKSSSKHISDLVKFLVFANWKMSNEHFATVESLLKRKG